ncbi:MAG: PPK2 family polyphosphate kinase [Pseudomonadota bacterium]
MAHPSIDTVRDALIAAPGAPFDLSRRATRDEALFEDKKDARASLEDDAAAIDELQDKLYAEGTRALLVVLQGMDCAGKSGTIRKVFALTSPLGMKIRAFKAPTRHDAARDFLWRVHGDVPPKGHIGIFDRSHYEDVLVVKVREFAPPDVVEQRYDQINQFEKLLTDTGTRVLKCMLHVGHAEQGERLAERVTEAHKHWKFNPGDLEDRALWGDFQSAYETAITRCSTAHAPWYIVPADSRTRRNAMVARLVRGALEDMAPTWPQPDPPLRLEDYDFG